MNYRDKFVVTPGSKVRLAKVDAGYTGKHESHEKAKPEIAKHIARMDKLQYLLYADATRRIDSMQGRVSYPLVAISTQRESTQREGDRKMNPATRKQEDYAVEPMLYMALELSNKTWKLTFGDGAKRR